ncbi:MAG: hypothetical protein WC848_03540 [Parcubacteria group bacterium]|jgi:hypothetical protein
MATIIPVGILFKGGEMELPSGVEWMCPRCGEVESRGGAYETFHVVQMGDSGEPIRIVLKGVCIKCGEDNLPPAPYLHC